MLPGFRFLFAAIVLTMSILIFGLGTAALLRASHEQFASIPARRTLPEPVFAQQIEPPAPTLAMLRLDSPVAEKAPDNPPPAAMVVAPAPEPAPEAVPVPPIETEKLTTLKIDEPASPETVRSEIAAASEPAPPAEASAQTPAVAEETRVAAVEETTPPAPTKSEPVALAPVIVPPAPESVAASARTAALASPTATVADPAPAKPKSAQADKSAARKRLRAQRAKERRRLAAQRARLAAAAQLQQQQAQSDPFAVQPTITPTPKIPQALTISRQRP